MSNKKPVDEQLVRTLADVLNDSNLSEIEIESGELRIRMSRQMQQPAMTAAPQQVPMQHFVAPGPAPAAAPPEAVIAEEEPAGDPVPSPMVGTVYLAAEPGARPFIEDGQRVTAGQTLLIIEAMKTMNQIPAPRDGTVRTILVENAEPVEYGQTLLILE